VGIGPPLETIVNDIVEFLRSNVLAPEVSLDAHTPFRAVGMESISLVELLLFIDRRFGVTIPESALTPRNVESAAALAQCAHERLAQREPQGSDPDAR
jgi:acyl carrier protein